MAEYLKIGVDIPDIDKQIAEAKAFKEELVKTAAAARGDLAPALDSAAAHAKKLADEFAKTKEEAGKIFAKGMSESLPEQLQDIAKGFGIATDKNHAFTTRLQGGVGAALIAKTAMMDLGSRVMEFGRAVDEANVRTEAQARRLRELGATTREIRAVNGDAVQSTDAYALRVHLLGEGLQATGREQAQLIELARRHKLAGEDNAAAIARVTAAINGDVAAQRLLGMSTAQGVTAQERMREAIALSTRERQRQGPVDEDAAERARRLAQQQQSGADAILRFVGAYTGLTGSYEILTRSAHGYSLLLQRIEQGLSGTTEQTRRAGRENGNLTTESGKLQSQTGRTKDQIQSLNEQLNRQRDLANQAATAQKSLAESLLEVNLAARAGETSGDVVNRNLTALNRRLVQRDQQRRTRNEVYRQAVRNGARASAVREELGMSPLEDPTRVAMEVSGNDAQIDQLTSGLRALGESPDSQMVQGARGRRSANVRYQLALMLLQRQLQSAQRFRSSLQSASLDNSFDVAGYRDGGSDRETFDTELGSLSSRGLYSAEAERQRTEMRRAVEARDYDDEKRRNMLESDRRGSLGGRIASQFGGDRSLEEHLAAPVQSAADSVKSSFDTMTQGLTGFMDTLIESPEKAGEAAVNLAKGVLKGLAMMALQKSLFSTAEGIVALVTPGMQGTAAGYFTAAGIYAGVAVAAGAGAAGIAASQRGAMQATPPGSNGSSFGPASAGRSGGDRSERGTVVFNINSTFFDTDRGPEVVANLLAEAERRGYRG